MANVYYKFNSELNFSHVGFDGLHISVVDLKKAILHQKRLGKSTDFDLLISNAQTKEEYIEDNCLIPKNTSVIVARVPVNSNQYNKKWDTSQTITGMDMRSSSEANSAAAENVDLSKMNGSEEDKIQAMIAQSTLDYDPSSYQRVRSTQLGEVPQNYRCHRCNKAGHWIKNCPMNPIKEYHHSKTRPESKKMTGIPRSLRDNPPSKETNTELPKIMPQKREPPEDLICSICKGIFKDAVMIPCCGSSFCDECIRTALLETDESVCPECEEKGTSPGSLIPNRFLRTNVAAFLSDSNSNSNVGKDKNLESHEEVPLTKNVISSPVEEDSKELEINIGEQEYNEIQNDDDNEEGEKVKKSDEKQEQSGSSDDDDEDDDNITVTVPPAPAAYKESTGMSRISHHRKDTSNIPDEPHGKDNFQQHGGQFQDPYYYDEPPPQQQQNPSFQPEESDKNYMSSIPSNSNQNMYPPPRNMYNQQPPTSQMPIRQPMNYGGPYPMQNQQQPPFYPQQQNVRPYRYEHHGDYQQQPPMRHHHHQHHQGPHYQQQQYSMPTSSHDNFGVRFQRPMNNLANIVSHNIQQRFGTGVIEDPLEAFNKIMREKEMRKDRFKRSPNRYNENRGRSPIRKGAYSPENRHNKSPHRRRKRTRSFSSNSSRSRSRSRSMDRHHNKDYRRKYNRDRNKPSDSRHGKPSNKSYSPEAKKANHDNAKSGSATRDELRPNVDEIKPHSNIPNDLSSCQPPPPGEEEEEKQEISTTTTESGHKIDEISVTSEKKDATEKSEKSLSSEETKHGKKVRDKKKHKKSEKSDSKSKKKKKRDRKERRSLSKSKSKSNTPIDSENNNINKNNTALDVENSKNEETDQIDQIAAKSSDGNDNKSDSSSYKLELSKWEKDDDFTDKFSKNDTEEVVNEQHQSESEIKDEGLTTEIIKRAENVIFSKSSREKVEKVTSVKESSPLLSSVVVKKDEKNVPTESRSIEVKNVSQVVKVSKNEPVKASIKERLGRKITERSRSRSRDRGDRNKSNDSKLRKHDNRKHLNSYISSAPSKASSGIRVRESRVERRSRSRDNRKESAKRHQRSKSRSPDVHKDRNNKSKISHHETSSKKEQRSKRRSDSPRSDDGNERKKMRSSSVDSKKHKKKKKKEKKAKKKSRDRK